MQKAVINFDWIEVFGYIACGNYEDLQNATIKTQNYKFVRQDVSGAIYKIKYRVYSGADKYLYDVYCSPRSSILRPESCTIRCSNEECYNKAVFDDLKQFMYDLSFVFKNFTRLDICHDSNVLKGGLTHESLIRNFLAGRFLLTRNLSFNLCGSQKQNSISTLSIHYIKPERNKKEDTPEGVQLAEHNEIGGIRWGSLKSAVGIKIYNKTQELRDVHIKQYIVNCWSDNGLDLSRDVWRIEVSLKSDSMKWLLTEVGELITLDADCDFVTKRSVELFYSICRRYFTFKINDNGSNKTRMRDLEIFDYNTDITIMKRYREIRTQQSNKMEKYLSKRLREESNDFKSYSIEDRNIFEKCAVFIEKKYNIDSKKQLISSIQTKEDALMELARWQVELYKRKVYVLNSEYLTEPDVDAWIPPLQAERPFSKTDVGITDNTLPF